MNKEEIAKLRFGAKSALLPADLHSSQIAFLFPGQGAQYPGMVKDFYDHFPIVREVFEEAEDLLSRTLSSLIFEGPAAELTLTKNSQLAIYVVSIAILRALQEQFPDLKPSVCAGLSLGEYSALTAAKKLSFQEGLLLVQARGEYMHDACISNPGTMQVILGLEADLVETIIKEINPPHPVWVANLNCPGQVVIAGTLAGVEQAAIVLKQKGAKRALPLDVAGAFHSELMREASTKLEPRIEAIEFVDSDIDLVMNVPGDYVGAIEDIRLHLVHQVTSPVRWESGIRSIEKKGVDFFLEIGCGKTLQGMNKRIGILAPTYSVEKLSDLEEFSNAAFKR
ncbi:MAG: ACP S-malonyltransferase [Anaerolineae bacterium]